MIASRGVDAVSGGSACSAASIRIATSSGIRGDGAAASNVGMSLRSTATCRQSVQWAQMLVDGGLLRRRQQALGGVGEHLCGHVPGVARHVPSSRPGDLARLHRCDARGGWVVPQVPEKRQQFRPPTCAATLDRAGSDAEDPGCLLDRPALHVDEHESRSLLRRQRREGGGDVQGRLHPARGVRRGVEDVLAGQRHGRSRRTTTNPVEARVDDNAVQPGGHCGVTTERSRSSVCGDQGVLDRIRGLFPVAERAQRYRPEPVPMATDELGECIRVPGNVRGQHLRVVPGLAHA